MPVQNKNINGIVTIERTELKSTITDAPSASLPYFTAYNTVLAADGIENKKNKYLKKTLTIEQI